MSESIKEERQSDFRELDKILKLGDLVRYVSATAKGDQYGLVTQRNETAVFPGFWITWIDRKWLGGQNGTMSVHSVRHFEKGNLEVVR